MYLLDVIPIARGVAKESLSYFSKDPIRPGTIVFVPLRKRTVPALVLSSKHARNKKLALRGSRFALKKIASRKPISFLPQEFMHAAHETALYSGLPYGAVLYTLLPQALLEELSTKQNISTQHIKPLTKTGIQGDKLIFQAETEERISRYRSMIRESFAQNVSLMLVAPTRADIDYLEEEVGRGVQEYTLTFHSGLTKRELCTRFEKLRTFAHPIVIIGTPQFVSLIREDVHTIIIERERSRFYKLMHRPHLDMRLFIEKYAEARQLRLIFSDIPLRVETLFRYREQELHEVIPPKLRLLSGTTTQLIDMRTKGEEKKAFTIFSDELKTLLERTVRESERCFLFAARRGIAATTVCKDCGSTVMSEDGAVPMMLQKTNKGNAFVSYRTGEMRSARERCRVCTSWRLEALGIGIERVLETLVRIVDPHRVFQIDKDTTPTHKKVQDVVTAFYKRPGSILVGTELALPYLTQHFENSAVVSMDSLLSLPEWRITERIFSIVLSLQGLSTKNVLVQTRKEDTRILSLALSGNIGEFYRDEIALREEFGYPPLSTLVKISTMGTPARTVEEMERIKDTFRKYDVHVYPAAFHVGKGKELRHALLRVPKHEWPHKDIIEKLQALPPHFAVDVDPENLL